MEKEINIAEILKDKPKGTKLYADAFGELSLKFVNLNRDNSIYVKTKTFNCCSFYSDGKYTKDGEPILVPSKEMRDWRKFDWKKGDVLISNDSDILIIFNGFSKDDYTIFEGKHWISLSKKRHISFMNMQNTQNYHIEDNKEVVKTYIKTIEERLGGKLNRETLEIEKQQEFKDGDVVFVRCKRFCYIEIFNYFKDDGLYDHASLSTTLQMIDICGKYPISKDEIVEIRLSTDSEKQQPFEALAKENKAWNAEKKQIVDLKPKCEFKPFDRCIWKIRNCEGSIWQASFVSYVDEYGAIPMGVSIDEDLVNLIILPYNAETAKLIGTTNNWEG